MQSIELHYCRVNFWGSNFPYGLCMLMFYILYKYMKSLRNYDNNLSFWLLYCLSFYLRLLIVTLVFSIFSYINNIVKNPYQFAMICGVRVTRSVDICACCLSFCPFSFGHCGVRLSSINGFWLPLCYLQTLLCPTFVQIIAHCQFFSRHCL